MTSTRTPHTGRAIGSASTPTAWTDGWNNGQPIAIHPHTALRFLGVLDPKERQHNHAFRLIHDTDRTKPTRMLYGTLADNLRKLEQANRAGYGVFVVINKTDGQGQTRSNIQRIRSVFVDLDGSPIPDDVERKAHAMVWTSPGHDTNQPRAHLYWRVTGVPVDLFRPIQQGLLRTFDGDPSVTDPPRVMRLPGFIHRKRAPYRVTLHHIDEDAAPLSLEELRLAFPLVEEALQQHENNRKKPETSQQPNLKKPETSNQQMDEDRLVRKIRSWFQRESKKIGETGRHDLLQRAARHLLDNGFTLSDADGVLLELRDHLPARPDGTLVPDSECRDVLRWTFETLTPGDPWSVEQADTQPDGPSLDRKTRRKTRRGLRPKGA